MIHEFPCIAVRDAGASPSEPHRRPRGAARSGTRLLVAFAALLGAQAVPGAQSAAPGPPTAAPPRSRPTPYTLSVTSKDGFIDVALKADGARLSDIAADLSARLRARVALGPSLQKETISVTVPESPLEPALMALAPRVLVDYEIRQDARPVPRDISLLGVTDAGPSSNTEERGMSQGVVIEGHTEDTPPTTDDPLKVVGDKQILSITVKKQPLALVARAIADVIGVPVDIEGDAGAELVDLDLRNAPPEDIIPRLSPNVRLHVRVDPYRQERTLLRLVLVSSPTK